MKGGEIDVDQESRQLELDFFMKMVDEEKARENILRFRKRMSWSILLLQQKESVCSTSTLTACVRFTHT